MAVQTKEKDTLLLIDGSNLAFRMFFALEMSNMRDAQGNPTWAVYGTLKALFDVIEQTKPSSIAVAFDLPHPTYRHELFEDYKANRPDEMPDEMKPQWNLIKECFRKLHVPVLEEAGFEADDLIGIMTQKASKENMKVVILSGDKDLFQLVDESTSIAMPRRGGGLDFYDPEKVIEKMGVTPRQVPDYKGIAGDSSDNIPGIKGLGPKAAIKLLGDYQNLEGIYENIDNVTPPKTKEKLIEQEDKARLSKHLATIIVEEEGVSPENLDLEKCKLNLPDTDALISFLKSLQFNSILKRLPIVLKPFNQGELVKVDVGELNETNTQINRQKNTERWGNIDQSLKNIDTDKNFKANLIKDAADLDLLIKELEEQNLIAVDLETTGLNTLNCEIVGWAFAYKKQKEIKSFYIPCKHNQAKEQIDPSLILEKLKPILEDESKKLLMQNAKFELKIFERLEIKIHNNFFDTMLASYIYNPANKHGLKQQAKRIFALQMTEIEDILGSGKKQINMADANLEQVTQYACADAYITYKLFDFYQDKLDAREIKILEEIEFPLVNILKNIENQGVSLDVAFLETLSKTIHAEIAVIEKRVFELAQEEFNIASPKQLGVIMFEKLELPTVGKKKKTGSYSTDMGTLETLLNDYELDPSHEEFIKLIIDFRTLSKLASTYIDNLPFLIAKEDNRLHSDFNQVATTTGRLSSSNPNLQNIPIKSAYGKEIRKAFKAKENKTLISADYSQIELRVLAHLADEQALIEAFQNDQDIHARTAMEIFDLKENEVSEEQRRIGKTLNFALIYMQGPFATAKQLGISMSEAKNFTNTYFKVFPKIKPFMDKTLNDARQNEFTETLFGRRRFFRNLNSGNKILQKEEERQAFNAGIQGTAADIMKIAMINIAKRLENYPQASLILQVHDEIIVETDLEIKDEIKAIIEEEMSQATALKVPLKVEAGEGANWLLAH